MGQKAERRCGACGGCFEPPHLLFTQSCGLVCVFCSIIEASVLPMLYAREDRAFRRCITPQFIGDNHSWDVLELFEELPKINVSPLACFVGSVQGYTAHFHP